jgi:hypothetical protein
VRRLLGDLEPRGQVGHRHRSHAERAEHEAVRVAEVGEAALRQLVAQPRTNSWYASASRMPSQPVAISPSWHA